jgi:hypothetical protein
VQTRFKSERLRATPLKLEKKRMGDPNNRFNLANPLARSLQEQQCKLRAKPYGHGFEG